jgi:ammonia channel protein AmtB
MSCVLENSIASDTPESVFEVFQLTFAIFTSGVIVGKFATGMRSSSVLVFSSL